MHLSSLTLTNIRQFDRRTFTFQPGFNLLVGENGAGKTTILRGLLAALGGAQQTTKGIKLEDDDIRLRARHAEVTAKVQLSNDRIDEFHFRKSLWDRSQRSPSRAERPLVLLYASNEATCSGMKVKQAKRSEQSKRGEFRNDEEFLYEREREMELTRRQPESGERPFGDSRSVRDFVGKVLSSFSHDFHDFFWRFEPYDCSLLPPKGVEMKQPLYLETQKHAKAFAMRSFQEGWQSRRRESWHWPDQAKVTLTPKSSELKRRGYRLPDLMEIWKGIEVSPEQRRLLYDCSLEVKLTPRIMIRRTVGPLSLSQLSDGEKRLFSLFVDIARQLLVRNPNNMIGGGEAIVMIDEIDVHLHPRWQRKIVPALEDLFLGCQFIATTHSPFVIQAMNRERITSIDPAFPTTLFDVGNSIEDIAENIQGVEVPQRSVRSEKLSEAAQIYFSLLKRMELRSQPVAPQDLKVAESNYREASEPFTSDPAVHALLKVEVMEARSL